MRFVKAIIGKLFQQVKNSTGGFFINAVLGGPLFKLWTLSIHRLFDLLTHRTAQQIRPAQRVASHHLGDLHHLFLIDDNTLGFFQNMVNQRVYRNAFLEAVFDLAIGGDILHWARPIQGHKRHNIFYAGRFHALERIHHARTFNLKHRNRFGACIQPVGSIIIQRYRANIIACP